MSLSVWELLIILLIVALLFGTKKLRNMGGDLGSAIKSFRGALREDADRPAGSNNDDTPERGTVIDDKPDAAGPATKDH